MKTNAITMSVVFLMASGIAGAAEKAENKGLQLKLVVARVVVTAYKTFKLPVPYKVIKNERGLFKYIPKGTPGYDKLEGTERTEMQIRRPQKGYPCAYYAAGKDGRLERFGVPGGYDAIPGKEAVVEEETLQVHMTNTGEDTLLSPLTGNAQVNAKFAMRLRAFDANGREVENRRRAITIPLAEVRKYIPAGELEKLRSTPKLGGGSYVRVPPELLEKHVPEDARRQSRWFRGMKKPGGEKYRPGGSPLTLQLFPAGKTLKFDLGKLPMQGASPHMGLQIPADGKYRVSVELVYPELGAKIPGVKVFAGKLVSNQLEVEFKKYASTKFKRPARPKPGTEVF